MSNELIAKRLQLLTEIAPGATRVAYLTYASDFPSSRSSPRCSG
jgi:hypothetical protein